MFSSSTECIQHDNEKAEKESQTQWMGHGQHPVEILHNIKSFEQRQIFHSFGFFFSIEILKSHNI